MGVINFSKANCKNCYSCVRACPVKAVRVKNEQAEILEERCITCGKCLKTCPKNAKEIESELELVKRFLKDKTRIAVSLAPSFIAAFGESGNSVCAALKKLGFQYVEETVVGAELIAQKYEQVANCIDGKCYITSCCPSVNDLIKKHYPNQIKHLIPVISPMECHGRIMKHRYGRETKVVFIGPCFAKKVEAKEDNNIDAVLTFEEINKWFKEEELDLNNLNEVPFDRVCEPMRRYPIIGGATHRLNSEDIKRRIIYVDGAEECIEVLKQIGNGKFKDVLVEMSLCRHGCIDGPAMPENNTNVYERRQMVKNYALNCQKNNDDVEICGAELGIKIDKEFKPSFSALKQPGSNEIRQILMKIGKYEEEDELNCGTCGYSTCKEKAVAVYNGLAELTMCLPFMRQRAETISNVLFDITPSIIIFVNTSLEIIDFNPAAENLFSVRKNIALGLPLSTLLNTDIVEEVNVSKASIFGKKIYLPREDATVIQSAVWVEKNESILVVLHDITEDILQQEKLKVMKMNTINMAQSVIEKQMRVAQEIASLLGETTAETKVSLTKLKRLIQGEEVN